MSSIGSSSDPSPSAAQYPTLTQMGLVPPPSVDVAYENLLAEVPTNGTARSDRTGIGTHSLFARQLCYDLRRDFPCITTELVAMKAVKDELLWLLREETNVRQLQERSVAIWDRWVDDFSELGPVYDSQWRSWPVRSGDAIDQITELIDTLRTDLDSQHMLVSAWSVSKLRSMALTPCRAFFRCYVADSRLSLQICQRSIDLFLRVSFNIVSCALLAHMLAQQTDLEPEESIWTDGDCHIYDNHIKQVRTQLSRMPNAHPFPTLRLERTKSIDSYDMDNIDASQNYEHHPTIRAPVAV